MKKLCLRLFYLILSITLVISLAFMWTGCEKDEETTAADDKPTVNNRYEVKNIDGKSYMVFEDYSTESIVNGLMVGSVTLGSIEELLDRLYNNDFEQFQYNIIKRFFAKDDNGIKLFDLNNIHKPTLPENMEFEALFWNGETCTFSARVSLADENSADAEDILYADIEIFDKDSFAEKKTKKYDGFFDSDKISVYSTSYSSDRSATETVIYTSVAKIKIVQYEVKADGNIYYILEEYLLDHQHDGEKENISDTTPFRVSIYGDCNDTGFSAFLMGFEARPSIEFLSSFGTESVNYQKNK